MRDSGRESDDDWLGQLSDAELDRELERERGRSAANCRAADGVTAEPPEAEQVTEAVLDPDPVAPPVPPPTAVGVPKPEPKPEPEPEAEAVSDSETVPEAAPPSDEAEPRDASSRRTGLRIGALIVGALIVALAAAAFGPQLARNASTEVVAVDSPVTLTNGAIAVTLVAPEGWHVVRPLGRGHEVALESPDGLVEFTLSLVLRPGAAGPPALPGADEVPVEEWSVEHPTPTTTATYARLQQPEVMVTGGLLGLDLFADGSPAHPGVIAAVAPEPASASGAVVDVLGTGDTAIEPYLGEFARIVASVEFAS